MNKIIAQFIQNASINSIQNAIQKNLMNAAVAKQLDDYTIDDIYNLPEGQRAELIDGELYMMAAPGRVQTPAALYLNNFLL